MARPKKMSSEDMAALAEAALKVGQEPALDAPVKQPEMTLEQEFQIIFTASALSGLLGRGSAMPYEQICETALSIGDMMAKRYRGVIK